ncbi:SIMPL domain-containing protein [Patescibacteria group bacterium]
MNNAIKNIIGVVAIIATLAFAYASYQYVKVYDRSSEPTNYRSFYVQAEGEAVGVPDIAQFSFDVISQGSTDIAKTQQENTEKMNAVLDYIDTEGIDKKDIKTLSYNIQPRYSTSRCEDRVCPPPKIVGYTVSQSAQVKIRDFSKISSLLSALVDKGANSVSQLSFTIDDPTELENEARADAIQKAKEKAALIAKEGGFSVGRILEINENFYPGPIYQKGGIEMAVSSFDMDEGMAAPMPAIEPGSQDINVQINIRYEIN